MCTFVCEQVAERTLQLGAGLGVSLAVGLALASGTLPRVFTSDPAVISAVGNIFPWVILSQPINALAFVWDGVLYGAGGFEYAAKVRHYPLRGKDSSTDFADWTS